MSAQKTVKALTLQKTAPAATTAPRHLLPQTRAIEIHLKGRFEKAEAGRLVKKVRQAGFNTILLDCFSRGLTAHPSQTMHEYGFPRQPARLRGTDPLQAILRAAEETDVTVYALVDCLRVGNGHGRNPILKRQPDWAVKGRPDSNGRAGRGFLCPVNRDVRRFLGDLFFEIMETYGFRGMYMRHLHYPLESMENAEDYCRCDYCRRAVHHSLGVRIESIPAEADHPDRYNLTAWRTQQMEDLVRYLKLRTDRACIHSLTIIEAYRGEVDLPPEHLGYQDPGGWAKERLAPIMALRPLPPTAESNENWLAGLAEMCHTTAVMPVLSVSPREHLVEILQRLSVEPIMGVVISEPHDLAAPPVNQLAGTVWRNRTQVAEAAPMASICALLSSTVPILKKSNPVRAFLRDVLRVLEPNGNDWPRAQRQALYDNLLGLEDRIADARLDLCDAAPVTLRNFRLARRLLDLMDVKP